MPLRRESPAVSSSSGRRWGFPKIRQGFFHGKSAQSMEVDIWKHHRTMGYSGYIAIVCWIDFTSRSHWEEIHEMANRKRRFSFFGEFQLQEPEMIYSKAWHVGNFSSGSLDKMWKSLGQFGNRRLEAFPFVGWMGIGEKPLGCFSFEAHIPKQSTNPKKTWCNPLRKNQKNLEELSQSKKHTFPCIPPSFAFLKSGVLKPSTCDGSPPVHPGEDLLDLSDPKKDRWPFRLPVSICRSGGFLKWGDTPKMDQNGWFIHVYNGKS